MQTYPVGLILQGTINLLKLSHSLFYIVGGDYVKCQPFKCCLCPQRTYGFPIHADLPEQFLHYQEKNEDISNSFSSSMSSVVPQRSLTQCMKTVKYKYKTLPVFLLLRQTIITVYIHFQSIQCIWMVSLFDLHPIAKTCGSIVMAEESKHH